MTVKGRVSVQIVASQEEFQSVRNWMGNVHLNALWICLGSKFDKSDTAFRGDAVAVVNVGPNTLDVPVVDVGNHVRLSVGGVAGGEVVVSLALPDCQ